MIHCLIDNNNNNNNNNNNIINNNNNNNNNNIPVVLKYRVGVRQGIAMPHVWNRIFSLVGNLPRDGVSIKTLVVVRP